MRIAVRSSRRRREKISLNLASMIDVTFLLLIYFIVTVVVAAREDRLTPLLQVQRETPAEQRSDFQPQIVEVLMEDGRPTYRLGTRVLHERSDLAAALEILRREEGLFIHVAEGVSVGFAVAAIQVAHDAGFDQVTYVPQR